MVDLSIVFCMFTRGYICQYWENSWFPNTHFLISFIFMVSFLIHVWLVYVSFIPIFNANSNSIGHLSRPWCSPVETVHAPQGLGVVGKPMGMKCSHQVEGWQAGWFSKISGSLDWENLGKILTGNHGFYHSIWGSPVHFPVNQSILIMTGGYPWISMTMITRIGFWDDYGWFFLISGRSIPT